MKTGFILFILIALDAGAIAGAGDLGFDNTPFIQGSKWRVHDSSRPQPRRVEPGTFSSQEQPGKPPSDAIVLFDGTEASKWNHIKGSEHSDAKWKVANGYMEVVPKTGMLVTKEGFGSCQLHLEWSVPETIQGQSQARGNSGVFLMGRYEIQVLDTYRNPTYADGHGGSVYGQYSPLVNALRKTGEWQVYDIMFEAPEFKEGKVVKPAYVTVLVNGVLVHNHVEILGETAHKALASYHPHADKEPLQLQDHGNPVRYRNIWIRPIVPSDLK